MGTWLAVRRVFRFWTPLQEDRSSGPVLPQPSDPLAFSLWWRIIERLARMPNEARVRGGTDFFRNLILDRLRLSLVVTDATCECGAPLDSRGRHRAVCSQSGLLWHPREPSRVCREARAIVRTNVKLWDIRDMSGALWLRQASLCSMVPNWPWTSRCVAPSRVVVSPGRVQPTKMENARADKAQKCGIARWGSLSVRCGCARDRRAVHRSTGFRGVSRAGQERPHPL